MCPKPWICLSTSPYCTNKMRRELLSPVQSHSSPVAWTNLVIGPQLLSSEPSNVSSCQIDELKKKSRRAKNLGPLSSHSIVLLRESKVSAYHCNWCRWENMRLFLIYSVFSIKTKFYLHKYDDLLYSLQAYFGDFWINQIWVVSDPLTCYSKKNIPFVYLKLCTLNIEDV